jgi:CubicO group peptidase (beta-lactamase class C family)
LKPKEQTMSSMQSQGSAVSGVCDDRFTEVRREFERNFSERDELGAGVCVFHQGKQVVSLWGGHLEAERKTPWQEDSLAVIFSSTKGVAATCVHLLVDQGELDFDKPVAHYWPEFAANGKGAITLGMVMSHQAGLPYWQQDLPRGALLDWEFASGRLAEEAPIWEPGTAHGYHAVTLGFLQGEVIRRATGRRIGQVLHEAIAEPLKADIWIGLPESEEARVATVYLSESSAHSRFVQRLINEPTWHAARLVTNSGDDTSPDMINSRARHASENPAAGGIASARGLASVYAPLSMDGSLGGTRIIGERALEAMRLTRSASERDAVLQIPTTFTLGYSKSWGARSLGVGEHAIFGEHAFGTVGWGGSAGFADPEAQLAFAYVMNRHGPGIALNERCQSLIDASYRALGFRSSANRYWTR